MNNENYQAQLNFLRNAEMQAVQSMLLTALQHGFQLNELILPVILGSITSRRMILQNSLIPGGISNHGFCIADALRGVIFYSPDSVYYGYLRQIFPCCPGIYSPEDILCENIHYYPSLPQRYFC